MACGFTAFPVKPWKLGKISGMFIVSRPIRCDMKPQKITDKPQHGLVTTWHETSWFFLPQQILNFTVFKYWNYSFVFQLICKQRIDMNDMLVTYYKKAMLNWVDRIRQG